MKKQKPVAKKARISVAQARKAVGRYLKRGDHAASTPFARATPEEKNRLSDRLD